MDIPILQMKMKCILLLWLFKFLKLSNSAKNIENVQCYSRDVTKCLKSIIFYWQ